ncbi:hypothetical protein SAMN04515671_0043 [Nakamurella panacisegetis]|uniref:Uncharacterized protein n=1 Tax=Nakamurella panacisegetis TaxID=1090615 RepID=A0A1H0HF10_9ACTN|nr:hypothetical protein [Nakamurella panacisegetis]SDO17663.1 hypothetical protein SAMN04515671_0043 [Nakamurella panacisegetis]
MSTVLTSISPIWKVLAVGLVLGAGLPALFALGIRTSAGTVKADGSTAAPNPAGRVVAGLSFLIVGLVVVAAIVILASTKAFLAKFGLS